jgi:hypothetical protein
MRVGELAHVQAHHLDADRLTPTIAIRLRLPVGRKRFFIRCAEITAYV